MILVYYLFLNGIIKQNDEEHFNTFNKHNYYQLS